MRCARQICSRRATIRRSPARTPSCAVSRTGCASRAISRSSASRATRWRSPAPRGVWATSSRARQRGHACSPSTSTAARRCVKSTGVSSGATGRIELDKSPWIWLDGRFVAWDEAQVHVLTHTLHYGLGVFEGIRCYRCEDGRSAIFRLLEHNRRLFDSAHILGIAIPYSPDEIARVCVEAVRRNALGECYIRPLVFLGDGEMGLAAANPVRVAIATWRWGAYLGDEGLQRGIRVKTSSFQRFHVNTLMPKAKAVGNYVNSILAAHEARSA